MPDKRDDAIDFIKGFFVLGMVVYHTTNYFIIGSLSFYIGIGGIALRSIFDSFKSIFGNNYFRIVSVILLLGIFLVLVPSGFNIRANITVAFIETVAEYPVACHGDECVHC